MKKQYQNRILRFVLSFLAFTTIAISIPHFFSSKGMGQLPWNTLFNYWGFLLFLALVTAIEFTYEYDDEEPFWEKIKRKKKKKETKSEKDD